MTGPQNDETAPQSSETTDTEGDNTLSRRKFAAGTLATTAGLAHGLSASTGSVQATTGRPTISTDFDQTGWDGPTNLETGRRGEVIDWSGIKLKNTTLQQAVAKEHNPLQNIPLWNLYSWRINQHEKPPQTKNGDGSSILDPISTTLFVGPFGITADLGSVADLIQENFTGKKGFITETASRVFASQLESDYNFVDSIHVCEGLKYPSHVGCYGDEISYSNPSANIRKKLTFDTTHTVSVDSGFDYDINYRALLVVQTYDTGVTSDLNKTFIATAAVYPDEIKNTVGDNVNILSDYSFVDESRAFMKAVNSPNA